MAGTDDKPSAIRAQLEDGRGAEEEGAAKTSEFTQTFSLSQMGRAASSALPWAGTDDKPSAIRAQLEDGRGAEEEGKAKEEGEAKTSVFTQTVHLRKPVYADKNTGKEQAETHPPTFAQEISR